MLRRTIRKNPKLHRRLRRKWRIRKKIRGTAERPRLCVFRSNKEIYAQLIDDTRGVTITSYSSLHKDIDKSLTKTEQSRQVGRRLAEIALSRGIEKVVFDRNEYAYHGRVKALAEGAREGGLKF